MNWLSMYRGTVRRVPGVDRLVKGAVRFALVPLLERVRRFRTSPYDPLWLRITLLMQSYEPETVAFVRRVVKPGMVALDVGAHVGYYARWLSRLVGRGGKVYAFEPNPVAAAVLRANAAGLGNVEVVQAAVADRSGVTLLFDLGGDSGQSTLVEGLGVVRGGESQGASRGSRGTYEVECVSLDEWSAAKQLERVDFVKMDIEGYELRALKGMEKLLDRSRELVAVVEFAPAVLESVGLAPAVYLGELRRRFELVRAIGAGGLLEDAEAQQLVHLAEQNGGRVNLACLRPRPAG